MGEWWGRVEGGLIRVDRDMIVVVDEVLPRFGLCWRRVSGMAVMARSACDLTGADMALGQAVCERKT